MNLKNIFFTVSAIFFINILFSFSFQTKSSQQEDPLKESMKRGKTVYETYCLSCHMEKGEGLEGIYPPLAESDYLMEDKERSIKQIINGVSGKMIVNGVAYDAEMPAQGLNDQETADVLNYIRNSWGNEGKIVKPEEVKALR